MESGEWREVGEQSKIEGPRSNNWGITPQSRYPVRLWLDQDDGEINTPSAMHQIDQIDQF